MRLLFNPTTFQGDIYALALYYQQQINAGLDAEVVIGVDNVAAYREEPIHQILPFTVPMWERSERKYAKRIKAFHPDFLFCDNHLPKKRIFENLVYLWHGFGWKEQRAGIEFDMVHKELNKLMGGVRQANPHFIHQCYGAFERDHRVQFTEFHPDNCRVMGNLYADLLINPPITREQIAPFYPFEHPERKTILLGFTWGFGEVFGNWDVDESALMDRLFAYLAEQETNVIFRLHDQKRYSASYRTQLEDAAKRYGNVLLKYKDVGRDNLFDVLLSDVIVSNFSGIVVYAYFTGAASIHIHPYGQKTGEQPLYRFKRQKAIIDKRGSYVWKMPPTENGGVLVHTENELFEQLNSALQSKGSCIDASQRFNQRYMENSDGQRCAALAEWLSQWHQGGVKPQV